MAQEVQIQGILRIREAQVEDAEALHKYCFIDQSAEEVTTELQADVERMEKGEILRFVADANSHAIGNIQVEIHKLNPEIGILNQPIVAEPFRTFGVADRLLEYISTEIQKKGVEILEVEVPKTNTRLIDAYRKWGFAERPVVTLQKHLVTEAPQAAPEAAPEQEAKESEEKKSEEKKSEAKKSEAKKSEAAEQADFLGVR